MAKIKRVQKQTAVQKALKSLRTYILSIDDDDDLRLPSEGDLAEQLGISRLTVREALTILEKEGFITRNQGASTTITSFAKKLTYRIEDAREIGKFIEDNGYKSSVDEVVYSWEKSDKLASKNLNIEENEEVLVVGKRFLADGIPAAYCVDRIPKKHFEDVNFKDAELRDSMFHFVEKRCNCEITHDFIEIKPVVSDEKLARLFEIEEGVALFKFETVEFTKEGVPIMYNTEYYLPKFVTFQMCRTAAYTQDSD